mmetsp:Transcript_66818/g.204569  ORF Transcript_66818/g.204569 Transcript_66818/m.204569 type:complete len:281 (+) Transcript_66818:884-1726(+)
MIAACFGSTPFAKMSTCTASSPNSSSSSSSSSPSSSSSLASSSSSSSSLAFSPPSLATSSSSSSSPPPESSPSPSPSLCASALPPLGLRLAALSPAPEGEARFSGDFAFDGLRLCSPSSPPSSSSSSLSSARLNSPIHCWNSVGWRSSSMSSSCTGSSRLRSSSAKASKVSSTQWSRPAYESHKACSTKAFLPGFVTWKRRCSSMQRPVSNIRSKCTMRFLSSSSTRKNHHSSNLGSGYQGACTGPIASSARRCVRSSRTVTVATSPQTISASSSTQISA